MEAIVEFGSQVSGGRNEFSDHDLLIVSNIKNKKELIAKYEAQGYSVSFYSQKQLELMKSKGSLFLQHLKHESFILSDEDSLFSYFINNCIFIHPSSNELEQCRKSLERLSLIPKDPRLLQWAYDYCYVISRDYFIKHFAQQNDLVFNPSQLQSKINSTFSLTAENRDLLLYLRQQKNIYRNQIPTINISWEKYQNWISILQQILGFSINSKVIHDNFSYLNGFDQHDISRYDLLRGIEAIRILFPDVRLGNASEEMIHRMITSQNNYSSTSVSKVKILSEYLFEFRERANKKIHVTPTAHLI